MGKTTYRQKLAYDWANKKELTSLFQKLNCSYCLDYVISELTSESKFSLKLILPEDVDKEPKEKFYKFIRENQSKVYVST